MLRQAAKIPTNKNLMKFLTIFLINLIPRLTYEGKYLNNFLILRS